VAADVIVLVGRFSEVLQNCILCSSSMYIRVLRYHITINSASTIENCQNDKKVTLLTIRTPVNVMLSNINIFTKQTNIFTIFAVFDSSLLTIWINLFSLLTIWINLFFF